MPRNPGILAVVLGPSNNLTAVNFWLSARYPTPNRKIIAIHSQISNQATTDLPTIAQERIGNPGTFPEPVARGGLKGRHDQPFGFLSGFSSAAIAFSINRRTASLMFGTSCW